MSLFWVRLYSSVESHDFWPQNNDSWSKRRGAIITRQGESNFRLACLNFNLLASLGIVTFTLKTIYLFSKNISFLSLKMRVNLIVFGSRLQSRHIYSCSLFHLHEYHSWGTRQVKPNQVNRKYKMSWKWDLLDMRYLKNREASLINVRLKMKRSTSQNAYWYFWQHWSSSIMQRMNFT